MKERGKNLFGSAALWALPILAVASGLPGWSATAGLGLNPGRLEIEVKPGGQKTVGFYVEAPPSEETVRGRVLVSFTDWGLKEDGSMTLSDSGTEPMSAAKWITFSPSAVSISSGQRALVRVTVDVPKDAQPGTYRTGLLVQERPPTIIPKAGEHLVAFHFRYMETLYVIVPPVAADPHLLDAVLEVSGKGLNVVCRMRNEGSALVRPYVTWSLRAEDGHVEMEDISRETTVLLPHSTLAEPIPLSDLPTPGRYQLSMAADFRDGKPIQSIVRTVEISSPAPGADTGQSTAQPQ